MESTCIICLSESPKYKCSTCYSTYCSPGCWKIHKDGVDCRKPEKVSVNQNVNPKKSYITEDTIPYEKLERLGSNGELKHLLKDPLLQKLLVGVDCSPNPYESVHSAMQDPSFVQFVDLCLGMVDEQESSKNVNF